MFNQIRLRAWSEGLRSQPSLPLRVELWNGQRLDFSPDPPRVTVRVPHARALRYLLSPSLYNLGRAYVEGAIDVSGSANDMIAVVNALAGNAVAKNLRTALPARALGRLLGALARGHTRQRDAAAVRYHYDVSNEFYAAWLDPGMVYSCAYFDNGDETLAEAQVKKIDHILTKIGVRPGHRLLDIGCGWGALAIRAAQRYGARCVGITLSDNQARLARAQVERAGLGGLVEIRLQDYRDVGGQFDRITSVGMFEHVGVRQLPAYFRRMATLLAPDGVAMNHGLTTTDPDCHGAPHGGGEFISRYVFPHGELAHLGTVIQAMQEGGLEVRDVENLRRHYARTCAMWTDNFEANAQRIKGMTDARRFRIWQVYLAGCTHAFTHDWISLYQVVCGKAGRDPAAIPWSRRYMYAQG
ncbi:SAM-dependent methyltransferase [Massilia pseudoviolaceinigra]|uniref:SAM-dependent methyltransferase n=1 Tax=Massilia pseudoviolaceinigra TaxID=3057165 RepID=UPI0027966565|nr:cyclopropane-fatty-acyl-phospholipid synthase family protein [Massilia sp. CCM 9206]MDQ1919660.1 cyclopropane-fatty-acyl-phospholipid synthase family protein [Massilia sp. CCM 9206]